MRTFLPLSSLSLCLIYSHHLLKDGVLTDLQETKDALVRASDLPLSILIVGVGGADFKQMEVCPFFCCIIPNILE